MKVTNRFLAVFLFLIVSSQLVRADEPWKSESSNKVFDFSGMSGVGIYDGFAGLEILGSLGFNILKQGFAPEINNQVFLELQGGPLFVQGSHAIIYNIQMRWDFVYSESFALFSLAGIGGSASSNTLGNSWRVLPRFGMGLFLSLSRDLKIRFEVARESIMGGLTFSQ